MNAKISAYAAVTLVMAAAAFGIQRQLPAPVNFTYQGQQVPSANKSALEHSLKGALSDSRKTTAHVTITDREVAIVTPSTQQVAQNR